MTPLIIDKTQDSPAITLDKNSGIFLFEGIAILENTTTFFDPVKAWISEYIKNPNQKTRVDFKLEYFNTSSSHTILKLLELFKELAYKHDLIINWFFREDDHDMLEAGEEFVDILNLPFNYLKR